MSNGQPGGDMRGITRWMASRARVGVAAGLGVAVLLFGVGACALLTNYSAPDRMTIPVTEFSTADYPEDPSNRSVHYGRFADRSLTLVQRDDTHFDFILEPTNSHTATVIFRNVDVSLMTPTLPAWVRGNPDLEKVALVDRQWNRQQVAFDRKSEHVEVIGGNGFERDQLFSAELAKNCLNAGLWEVLLFTQENGQKAMYYQGWFTFPLGHYKRLFERVNGIPYETYRWRLEHWLDPEGTRVDLDALRQVVRDRAVTATFLADEPIFASGEQQRKLRTLNARNLVTWKDFYDPARSIEFASFVKPGRYDVRKPHAHELWRLARFTGAALRDVTPPGSERTLQEIELRFLDQNGAAASRFLVGGVDLAALPQLAVSDYPKGLYMPMGIGVPPFYQSYQALEAGPPARSPYFSVLVDAENRWINHHDVAIDGVAMHRDLDKPSLVHVYLLSYERHSLIGHFLIETSGDTA